MSFPPLLDDISLIQTLVEILKSICGLVQIVLGGNKHSRVQFKTYFPNKTCLFLLWTLSLSDLHHLVVLLHVGPLHVQLLEGVPRRVQVHQQGRLVLLHLCLAWGLSALTTTSSSSTLSPTKRKRKTTTTTTTRPSCDAPSSPCLAVNNINNNLFAPLSPCLI